ncbi:MAG: hypothetical protein K2Z81_21070, partial [Cyanobacteria bacterium]|nr:hypothetical protein [Cyanobacteriota bacterium]
MMESNEPCKNRVLPTLSQTADETAPPRYVSMLRGRFDFTEHWHVLMFMITIGCIVSMAIYFVNFIVPRHLVLIQSALSSFGPYLMF